MRICELKTKEVININSCQRLGFVGDVDFNMQTGCIVPLLSRDQEVSADFYAGKKST